MKKMLWVLLLLILPLSAGAEIYKCQVSNKVIFSGKPCGQDAKTYQVGNQRSMQYKSTASNSARTLSEAETERLALILYEVKKSISNYKYSIAEYYVIDNAPPNIASVKAIEASSPKSPHVYSISITPGNGVLTAILAEDLAKKLGGDQIIYSPRFSPSTIKWTCSTNISVHYIPWCN